MWCPLAAAGEGQHGLPSGGDGALWRVDGDADERPSVRRDPHGEDLVLLHQVLELAVAPAVACGVLHARCVCDDVGRRLARRKEDLERVLAAEERGSNRLEEVCLFGIRGRGVGCEEGELRQGLLLLRSTAALLVGCDGGGGGGGGAHELRLEPNKGLSRSSAAAAGSEQHGSCCPGCDSSYQRWAAAFGSSVLFLLRNRLDSCRWDRRLLQQLLRLSRRLGHDAEHWRRPAVPRRRRGGCCAPQHRRSWRASGLQQRPGGPAGKCTCRLHA